MACNGNSADCYFLGYFPWPCVLSWRGRADAGCLSCFFASRRRPLFYHRFCFRQFHLVQLPGNRICGAVIVLYGVKLLGNLVHTDAVGINGERGLRYLLALMWGTGG